jgi:hypothetical protein
MSNAVVGCTAAGQAEGTAAPELGLGPGALQCRPEGKYSSLWSPSPDSSRIGLHGALYMALTEGVAERAGVQWFGPPRLLHLR